MKAQYFKLVMILGCTFLIGNNVFSQDPNFHLYLSFGQSNMEGYTRFESQDTIVDKRFQVLQAVDCPNLNREKGHWYPAVPPLSRCNTGLSPGDYFGRTMVAKLPEEVKIGIINVSVGGCKIELFDENNVESYLKTAPDWLINTAKKYDNNPYGRLVEMAKLAQQKGVIKGVLLHQGESNTNDTLWTKKVKLVYDKLMKDLNLHPEKIPLLAGEVVHEDQGGRCASMNQIIATLPETIPNAYVISSKGCQAASDNLHFSAEGTRLLGERYAIKMFELLNNKN